MDIIQSIINDEGFRSRPYKDTAGKLTIGYGLNIDDMEMTKKEAL